MKIKNNQEGIAHIAAILIVVVLIVVGFVGWKVWGSNNQKNPASSLPSTEKKAATPSKNNSADDENIVKLPNMGIQFYVPDTLKSLEYVESTASSDPSIKTGFGSEAYPLASIVLPSLDTPDCKLPEKAGGYLGVVWKVTGQYPKDANVLNSAGVLVKQFNSYYIGYRVPIVDCSSDKTQQSKIESYQDQLKTALMTATEIN